MAKTFPELEGNRTPITDAPRCCVHEFFEQQMQKWAGSVAAVFGAEQLSYEQLNVRANQVARHLRARGAGPDVLVGLCMERSLDMLVALLGILKAGAAYVPLDPALPEERLAYLLNDSMISLLLTQQRLVSSLPVSRAEIIALDTQWSTIHKACPDNLGPISTPESLAYMIYTSGSTGRPKGVCLPHRVLTNLLVWQLEQSQVGCGERTLQFTSLSFDVSFQEILATWCGGGSLVLIAEELRRNPALLLRFLEEQRIARLFLPFVALQQLAAAAEAGPVPDELREVITAGEQLRITPQIRSLFSRMPLCTLFNHYGPSETHVVTSYTLPRATEKWDALPPIGKPISNTQLHILDAAMSPAPVGEVGELYIGGVPLARGYHNRPDLTAERFVPDPFASGQGMRLYKTGDYCRYLPDGNVQYVGRLDGQVKVRGHRVELGEFESGLGSHRGVQQCLVVAREDTGEKRLVAYFVASPEQRPSVRHLRDFLRTKLPEYMVPVAFVTLPAMPVTPNGKLDRRALPAPSRESSALETELVPPKDELERKLVAIWESVLKISPIGTTDNIFDLGIDSLLAAELFARIEKTLGKNLPPAPLFQAPTVEALAGVLRRGETQRSFTSLVAIQARGTRTPLFCVHGGAGTVLLFNSLARHLAPERPVYGLQARGLYGRERPHTNVEEMAAHYVSEIRSLQPHGPYLLAGWCFGGIVAYEVAQRMQQLGEKVDLLVMFNAASTPDHYLVKADEMFDRATLGQARRASSRWQEFSGLKMRAKLEYVRRRVRGKLSAYQRNAYRYVSGVSRRMLCRVYITLRLPLPDDIRNYYFLYMNTIAESLYQPKPYSGDILIFRDQGPYRDPNLGWGRFVNGDIESHEVPVSVAHHRALMQEPVVGLLAKKIEDYLAGKSSPAASQTEVLVRAQQSVQANVVQ
jgi:amino acid adenylation domain-containing protein